MQSVEQLWDAMETKDLTELVSILNKQRLEDNAIHELYHPEESRKKLMSILVGEDVARKRYLGRGK